MTRLAGKVFTKETIKIPENVKLTAREIANMHSNVDLKSTETNAEITR